jgi:cytochrome c oxidase assembly factor CtaG
MLARPAGPLLWGLPQPWRRGLGAIPRNATISATWQWITRPGVATLLHGLAIWVWHVPGPFEAALAHEGMHWLQHASFLITALLFWWALLQGRSHGRGYGAAVMYLFATTLHTTLLGALLVLSPRPWYPASGSSLWNLTPLEDQQLAGLVMWVPAGLVYWTAALALGGLWIVRSGDAAGRPQELRLR